MMFWRYFLLFGAAFLACTAFEPLTGAFIAVTTVKEIGQAVVGEKGKVKKILGAISALAGGIKAGSKAMKNELQDAVDDIESALVQMEYRLVNEIRQINFHVLDQFFQRALQVELENPATNPLQSRIKTDGFGGSRENMESDKNGIIRMIKKLLFVDAVHFGVTDKKASQWWSTATVELKNGSGKKEQLAAKYLEEFDKSYDHHIFDKCLEIEKYVTDFVDNHLENNDYWSKDIVEKLALASDKRETVANLKVENLRESMSKIHTKDLFIIIYYVCMQSLFGEKEGCSMKIIAAADATFFIYKTRHTSTIFNPKSDEQKSSLSGLFDCDSSETVNQKTFKANAVILLQECHWEILRKPIHYWWWFVGHFSERHHGYTAEVTDTGSGSTGPG